MNTYTKIETWIYISELTKCKEWHTDDAYKTESILGQEWHSLEKRK